MMKENRESEVVLVNIMEEMVQLHIDDCIRESGLCPCEHCRLDVYALAVNNLDHHYVATSQGDLIIKVRSMTIMGKGAIIAAIMQGIVTVRDNPRHDPKKINDLKAEGENMDEKIIVKNTMEELVEMQIDKCIQDAGTCGCERCRADIFAIALNYLPARYVATTKGDLFVRINAMTDQGQADIISAIMSGIIIVKEKPRHDD